MKLEGAGEVRRGGRVVSGGTAGRKSGGLQTNRQAQADRVSLSRAALSFLEEQNARAMEAQARQQSREDQESAALKRMEKALKAMMKCQKIAARVSAGDKVPPEDLRYLKRNDPDGYKLALATRRPKKHPKEWKSALEEEDLKEAAGRTESASAESSAAGGAGEA